MLSLNLQVCKCDWLSILYVSIMTYNLVIYYMSSIDIRVIKIILDTNIPGKEVIPLTKSILFQPDEEKNKDETVKWANAKEGWNEMPYFTMDVPYPEGYLSKLSYAKQMEFFFVKKKMTEIIKLNTKTVVAPVINDGLITKESEQHKNIKETQEKVEAQKIEKQQDIIQENIMKEKQQDIIQTEQKNTDNQILEINNLTCRTIEKIDGKPLNSVTYDSASGYKVDDNKYVSFEDYLNNKTNSNIDTTVLLKNTIDGMINLDKIKEIFKPNEEFINKKTGFFGFGGDNKDKLDDDGLYKDEFCKVDSLKETIPPYLFAHNRSSNITWNTPTVGESYKSQLLSLFQSIKSNPLFDIPTIDDIIKGINEINDKDIKLEYGGQWIETDKNLCLLLPEIRKAFNELKPKLEELKLVEYPDKANKKLDEFKTEYANAKAILEQKKTNVMIGGNNSINDNNLENTKNDIAEKNIMIMIRLLFPTKYPLIGNILSSFHSVVTGQNEFHLKWMDFVPSFFKKQFFEGISDYSYIQVDGKTYTVIQAIWLNDIYNHTEYLKLVEQFEELQKWKSKEARKSEIVLQKKRDQFSQTYNNAEYKFNDIDIDNINYTLKSIDSGRGAEYSLAKYRITIEQLIKAMKEINKAKQLGNNGRLIENSKIFADLYLELQKTQWFNPKDKIRYEKIAQKMKDDTEKIQSEEHILKNYLQSPGINMDYERDKYREILEQKYSLYVRFVENIRKYRTPVLESSNSFLQNSIDDFLDKTEKYKGVFNFLMNRLNIKKNPYQDMLDKNIGLNMIEMADIETEQKNYMNRLNTGITIRPSAQADQPYYEVYIQLNLIGGELNDTNISAIDCMFQGETLGDKLSRILNEAIYNPWNINSSRVFFDITQGAAKEVLDKKNTELNEATGTEIQGIKKIGGLVQKKSMRKYRELFMRKKTQKQYTTV